MSDNDLGEPGLPPVREALSPERRSRINAFVDEQASAGQVPGVALVIGNGRQVIHRTNYGLANAEQRLPMTEQSVVAIGSTTQGMTALALMQFVEQGEVGLDDPVTAYLPYFKTADDRQGAITIRQLLSHSSGLPASLPEDRAQDAEALERRVRSLANVSLNREPGAGFEYANDGYATLGLIIQTVSGLPYEDYLATNLFAPLGMERTTFDPEVARTWALAQGYIRRHGTISPAPTPHSRSANPAGGVFSTAADIDRYVVALLNDGRHAGKQIVSVSSLDEMWRPQVEIGGGMSYGFGWFVLDFGGLRVVAHTGDNMTSGSSFVLMPALKMGLGVLVNLDSDAKDDIARGVASLLLGQEPEVRAPIERGPNRFIPDRTLWERYTGWYESHQGAIRVERRGDSLFGVILNQEFELEPYSDIAFVAHSDLPSLDGGDITFTMRDDGTVLLSFKGEPFAIKGT